MLELLESTTNGAHIRPSDGAAINRAAAGDGALWGFTFSLASDNKAVVVSPGVLLIRGFRLRCDEPTELLRTDGVTAGQRWLMAIVDTNGGGRWYLSVTDHEPDVPADHIDEGTIGKAGMMLCSVSVGDGGALSDLQDLVPARGDADDNSLAAEVQARKAADLDLQKTIADEVERSTQADQSLTLSVNNLTERIGQRIIVGNTMEEQQQIGDFYILQQDARDASEEEARAASYSRARKRRKILWLTK